MRTLGGLVSELTYLDSDELDGERLHALLGDSLGRCGRVGQLLQQQYSLQ